MHADEIRNQLVYSTVKISATNGKETATGTGFFVTKEYEDRSRIIIVTNKHVIKGFTEAQITLCESDDNWNPIDNRHVVLRIQDLQSMCRMHPDDNVDLCALAVGDVNILLSKLGTKAYFRSIGFDFLISKELEDSLTAIEDVVMIGYPLGLMDEENNKPVVRKGTSATSIALDYNGKKEFVIDIACFPGSSGSPVFLERTGLSQMPIDGGTRIGVSYSYSFIGVVYAVPLMTVKGDIKVEEVPTMAKLFSETQGFMNLGYVIKAERIRELFETIEEAENNSDL